VCVRALWHDVRRSLARKRLGIFSPDDDDRGFRRGQTRKRRLEGPVVTVAAGGGFRRGVDAADTIVFSSGGYGISEIPAAGGPVQATTLSAANTNGPTDGCP
jgi:hypothetical protein